MYALTGVTRDYAWGSRTSIPEFLGQQPSEHPVAETWFGAHPSAPSPVPGTGGHLADLIAADPHRVLGPRVVAEFGEELPFLVKLIAPAAPLSLQVHPNLAQAQDGYARARASGHTEPSDYVDANHKPELLYPLTEFEALCGIRSSTQVSAALDGLDAPVLNAVREYLAADDVGAAFAHVLQEASAQEVSAVVAQCAARFEGESPCATSDEIAVRLAEAHPGDSGVIASLFLTPRRLHPRQVMYIPPGVAHLYLSGFGVEVLANSDNVLRAGLTPKHVDVAEVLRVLDPAGTPSFPEEAVAGNGLLRIPSPEPDFEVMIADAAAGAVSISVEGPWILLALEPSVVAERQPGEPLNLGRGEAAFLTHGSGGAVVHSGRVLATGLPSTIRTHGRIRAVELP